MPQTILAIDPGVRLGWAVVRGRRRIASGVEKLTAEDDRLGARFMRAREHLRNVLVEHAPDIVVCERMGYFQQYSTVLSMYGIVAMITEMCGVFGVPFTLVSPNSVKKKATGSGKATKAEMRAAASHRWKLDRVLNDEADALWIAETYRTGK